MNVDAMVGVVTVVVSLAVAWLVAKYYGDMAAAKATREYQEELAKRARVAALQSLMNEVGRIERVVEHYLSIAGRYGGMPRMPMTAFETAFVSGSPGVAADERLMRAVGEYLCVADTINSYVDMFLLRGVQEILGEPVDEKIRLSCNVLPDLLCIIKKELERELALLGS
jgi:hypothetical protein